MYFIYNMMIAVYERERGLSEPMNHVHCSYKKHTLELVLLLHRGLGFLSLRAFTCYYVCLVLLQRRGLRHFYIHQTNHLVL